MLDFIIVGQGIAGSVLAWELLQRGQRLWVINNQQTNCASSAAAGIYNPITGKAMVKTWLADTLFPQLIRFYLKVGQTLGASFLHPTPLFRPFLTPQERIQWLIQSSHHDYSSLVEAVVENTYHQERMVYQHGGLLLRQAGYLDVPYFLSVIRDYLIAKDSYTEADFVHEAIALRTDHVRYRDIKARQVLFCEGPQAKYNPWFSTLPFRLVKGEMLSVALEEPLDVIYNRRGFVVPRTGRRAIVGATYDRDDWSLAPTRKARQTLETQLQRTFKLPYTVQDQWAGIRPATFDRRPFIGVHPQYPQLGLFNGLGTKGVSLAPHFAQVFADHLLLQTALPQEVRLTRKLE